MRKIFHLFIPLIFLFPSLLFAENLTLTTYYPAPFGVYDQLRLFPRAPLGTPCKIGTLYVTSPDGIQFCQDDGTGTGIWGHPSGIWDQLNDDIYLTDTSRNPNLAVGIGTIIPNSRLTIKGIGITNATASLNVLDNADTSILLIKDDGNIGLGTITPQAVLNIIGDTYDPNTFNDKNSDADLELKGDLYVGDTNNGIWLTYGSGFGTLVANNGNDLLLNGGNVDVNIEAHISSPSNKSKFIITNPIISNDPLFIVNSLGAVGIGTTTPGENLDWLIDVEVENVILEVNGQMAISGNNHGEALIFKNSGFILGDSGNPGVWGDFRLVDHRNRRIFQVINSTDFFFDNVNVYPDDDNTLFLGLPKQRWAKFYSVEGYFSGKVGIGRLDANHPLHMASGAHVTNGGVWIDASSIEYKQDIAELTTPTAYETLKKLNPVTFRFKVDPEEKHAGFIAEDVPDLVATKDRKGLSPMDIVAILTKVVQDQQKAIQGQQKIAQNQQQILKQQQKEIEQLKIQLNSK